MARDFAVAANSRRPVSPAFGGTPLSWLRAEMDQWFDEFPARLRQMGQRDPASSPALDMTESDDGYQLTAEVPGMDAADVEVTVGDGMLRIACEKRDEREEQKRDYLYSERTYGRLEREIALPPDIDAEKIGAKVKNGVLRITLPKDKAAGARHNIKVEAD